MEFAESKTHVRARVANGVREHRTARMGPTVEVTSQLSIPTLRVIRLTAQDVAEFRELFRKETGNEITDEQAREYAERLIRVVAFAIGVDPFPPPPM
jgi:hypothetical protein